MERDGEREHRTHSWPLFVSPSGRDESGEPVARGKQRAPSGFLNLGFKIRKELLSSESVSWERSDALGTPGRRWYSQSAMYQVGINRSHWLKLSQGCGWGQVTTSLQRCGGDSTSLALEQGSLRTFLGGNTLDSSQIARGVIRGAICLFPGKGSHCLC